MAPIVNEVAKVHLLTCFAEALQRSIAVKCGGHWICASSTTSGHGEKIEADNYFAIKISLRGTLHGELRLEIVRNDAKALFEDKGVVETLEESWGQIMEGMIQRLPKRAADAGLFAFSVGSYGLAEPSTRHFQIGRMDLGQPGRTNCVLLVLADGELVESLRAAEWNVSNNTTGDRGQQTVTSELGRVIDVPLVVTLRFGQRNMRLHEVLELNTGALVELDRQVEDPVDLILDERVIARGEVVIVDGNYGLRVTEILERPTAVARQSSTPAR